MRGHGYRALKVFYFFTESRVRTDGGRERGERERDKRGRWGLCEGVKEKNLLNNR